MGKFHRWLGDELSLYVRQLAWLMAIPKADKKKLAATEEPVSRLKQIEADGLSPDLPPLPAPIFIEYLFEVGPMVPAGMGSAAIGWLDLAAWQDQTGRGLPPWQTMLLRRLSRDYVNEFLEADKPDRAAPWAPDRLSEEHRASVDAKVRAIFGARARS